MKNVSSSVVPVSSIAVGLSLTGLTVINRFSVTVNGPPDPVPPKSLTSTSSCTSPLKLSSGINISGSIAFEILVIDPEKINDPSESPSPKLKIKPLIDESVIAPLSTESCISMSSSAISSSEIEIPSISFSVSSYAIWDEGKLLNSGALFTGDIIILTVA